MRTVVKRSGHGASCARFPPSRAHIDRYSALMAGDLATLIASGRVESERAIYVVIATCKAVADLVGGLPPSRVLLSKSGDVTIGDITLPSSEEIGYVAPEFGEAPVSPFQFPAVAGKPVSSRTLIIPSPGFEIDRPRAAVSDDACSWGRPTTRLFS